MMSALVWVTLWALILLAILAVLAGVFFGAVTSMSGPPAGMGGGILGRLGRLVRASLNAGSRPALRQVTLETLQPGDAIEFWDGQHALVENVLDCTEELHGRLTRWQWVLLDTGAVLEIGREGRRIFDRSVICYQGSAAFEELIADPERGGVLKTFEQRVREGRSATEPVVYEHGGMRWVVRSTGTFAATVRGRPLEREVWADISSDPGQNVYFEWTRCHGTGLTRARPLVLASSWASGRRTSCCYTGAACRRPTSRSCSGHEGRHGPRRPVGQPGCRK